MRSIPGVSEVTLLGRARDGAAPELLLEVAHGATRAAHFDELRAVLRGPFPESLREFFFVNTDVGAPEVALHTGERVVAADPERAVAVVRCLVPRTFVDTNRVIAADAQPRGSAPGALTPGLHAWVRDPKDRALLLARHRAYQDQVEAACATVCAAGGRAVFVHSYAPRSIDVAVDADVVAALRAEYAPERLARWPLRAPVDLIVDTPEGERLADPELAARAARRFAAAGFDVAHNAAYALVPGALVTLLARRHPGRTLCLELRRDLLVPEFTPFVELRADPDKVERAAAPLADALGASG
jgi:hypothetical protein